MLEDRELEEGELHKFEVLSILKGNLDPLEYFTHEVAYKNLDYKMTGVDAQVGKLIKLQQLGVQYLLFRQKLNHRKANVWK